MVFRSKHGQISIVQDICGLLIEYHNKGNSIWPLRTRKQTEDRLQHGKWPEQRSWNSLAIVDCGQLTAKQVDYCDAASATRDAAEQDETDIT